MGDGDNDRGPTRAGLTVTLKRRQRLNEALHQDMLLKSPYPSVKEEEGVDESVNASTTNSPTGPNQISTGTGTTRRRTTTERWRGSRRSNNASSTTGKGLASGIGNGNGYKVLARSIRTAKEKVVEGSGGGGGGGGGMEEFRRMLMIKSPAPAAVAADAGSDEGGGGMSNSSPGSAGHYVDVDAEELAAGVSRRLLDIHQISTRLHRSFPWEGLGLHNGSTGGLGKSITQRIGFSPQDAPHSLVFSSFYIVPVILLLGVVVGVIWLLCACFYHTMRRIKIALCPGRSRSEDAGGSNGKKGKNGNGNGKGGKNNSKTFSNGNNGMEETKPQIFTPEMIEMRRQERLVFLQEECANLEQQLTGLRASLPQQSSFEEKSATLTSRASDSDLEYLGASESPPLKRNSISLQNIPQSVIRIRREKELRQIKEEIEYLRSIAQQEKEKAAEFAQALKDPMMKGSHALLLIQDYELPPSKPGSPGESKVEPLSQHISHLKTQRKLTEIRTELEDLAIQLLHADEIKAKRNSLQDLPRTTLNIQREQKLVTMTNELQKMRNYKMQKICVIETALEKTNNKPKEGNNKNNNPGKTGSKSFNNKSSNANPSNKSEDSAAKYSDPEFTSRASIRRQREQELNRVRVELKDLAYKLNLNPMNYISEDRVRLVPSQSMQSTTSAGQSSAHNKSASTSSALNHV